MISLIGLLVGIFIGSFKKGKIVVLLYLFIDFMKVMEYKKWYEKVLGDYLICSNGYCKINNKRFDRFYWCLV